MTIGDPLYDAADWSATSFLGVKNIGIVSQVYFSEPSCQNSGFDLASSSCTLAGHSLVDPCGPLNDGGGPLFGFPLDINLHGVVKNCPGVINEVLGFVTPYASSTQLNLANTNLSGAILSGANLAGSDLANANLLGADLSLADLTDANLTGANLAGANLSHATLVNAQLTGSNLQAANLTGTNLTGAALSGANVNGVTWSDTGCPDGTNSDADGGSCAGHL